MQIEKEVRWKVKPTIEYDEFTFGADFVSTRWSKIEVDVIGRVNLEISSEGKGGIYGGVVVVDKIIIPEIDLRLTFEEGDRDRIEFLTIPESILEGPEVLGADNVLVKLEDGDFNPFDVELYLDGREKKYTLEAIAWGGAY